MTGDVRRAINISVPLSGPGFRCMKWGRARGQAKSNQASKRADGRADLEAGLAAFSEFRLKGSWFVGSWYHINNDRKTYHQRLPLIRPILQAIGKFTRRAVTALRHPSLYALAESWKGLAVQYPLAISVGVDHDVVLSRVWAKWYNITRHDITTSMSEWYNVTRHDITTVQCSTTCTTWYATVHHSAYTGCLLIFQAHLLNKDCNCNGKDQGTALSLSLYVYIRICICVCVYIYIHIIHIYLFPDIH